MLSTAVVIGTLKVKAKYVGDSVFIVSAYRGYLLFCCEYLKYFHLA